jgi:hypothetical protein
MRIPLLAFGLLSLTLGIGYAQVSSAPVAPDSQRRIIRSSPSQSSSDSKSDLGANYQLRLKGAADKNTFLDITVIGSGRIFSIQTAEEQPAHFQGKITPEGEHFAVDYGITETFKVPTDPNLHVAPGFGGAFRDATISGSVKLTPGKAMRIAEVNGKVYTLEIRPAESPEK